MKQTIKDLNQRNSQRRAVFDNVNNIEPLRSTLYASRFSRGMSTVEMLIALSIFVLVVGGLVIVSFGNQTTSLDTQLSNGAVLKTQKNLELMKKYAAADWNSASTTSQEQEFFNGALLFKSQMMVTDVSECVKQVTSTTTYQTSPLRSEKIQLDTTLTSTSTAAAMGGDCATTPPSVGWDPPDLFASDTINPGKFNALDVLQQIVYLGGDHIPYLFIADTRGVVLGDDHFSHPMIVSFANSFNASGDTIDEINDIDVYKNVFTGKVYAFVAEASTTAQLVVLDVTDIHNPFIAQSAGVLAKRKLNGITATDSTAWGWRLQYYGGKLYVTARETAGHELHVFDVADPTNPVEVDSKELNTTVNDFVVRDDLGYFAVDSNARGPLLVYKVSNPISEVVGARGNITGSENGLSIFLLGNKLYLGRQKTSSGNEFYILDASSPKTAVGGLPIFGPNDPNKELGTDITSIRVAGRFAFLATYANSSGGFKIWDISDPSSIQSVNLAFNFGNKPVVIDYEPDFVYAGSESTPNFQILYSPPPFEYTLANSGGITVTQGSSGNTTITRTLVSGSSSNITLSASGLPAGATPTFTNNPCTPTCSSTLTIATTFPTTPVGTYPITVTGTGGETTTFNLVVSPQPFDYTLSAPADVTLVRAGASKTTSITATIVTGSGTVNFTNLPLPSGVTMNYSATTCTPNCTITLTLSAAVNATVGTSQVTITGDSPSHSTTFNVTVNAPAFNFNLVDTGNIAVTRGGPAVTNTITVTMTLGASVPQSVLLSNSILPTGVSVTYAPVSGACTPSTLAPYQCTVVLSFTAAGSAPTTPGQGPTITVTGTSGAINKTTSFKVDVQ